MSAVVHAERPQWRIDDGCLIVGGVPLTRIAHRAGRTPFYAYDRALLDDRVASLR